MSLKWDQTIKRGAFHFGCTSFSRLNFIQGISPVLWSFQCTDAYSSCVFQIVAQRAGETQVRCQTLWPLTSELWSLSRAIFFPPLALISDHLSCLQDSADQSVVVFVKKYRFLFLCGLPGTDLKQIWYNRSWNKSLTKQWMRPSAREQRLHWACQSACACTLSLRACQSHASE